MITKNPTLPFVSVVIPMYNAAATLEACLESLRRLDYPPNRLEILFVDGRSTDGSRTIARAYPVRLIDNPRRGVVSGRNRGFDTARGEFIAFSDADCTFDASWIRNAILYFKDETVAGVTGPIELPLDQNIIGKCINLLFRLAAAFAGGGHENDIPAVQRANHLPTCNAIFRTALLRKVMPIPEHFVTGEDVAMSHCLQLMGYQLLSVPDVRVHHYKRSTLNSFAKQMRWYAIARGQVSRMWPELQHPLHRYVPLVVCGFLLLIGALCWMNIGLAFLLIGLGWLFLGLVGCVYTGALRAFVWQPLVVLIFMGFWTLGFIEVSLYPKRLEGRMLIRGSDEK